MSENGRVVAMDPIQQAQQFAALHHVWFGKQSYGVLPYTHHLAAVEAVLLEHGFAADVPLRVAAWLHDVVEDCAVKQKHIEEMFGSDVAALVWAVTNEPGENRKARHAATYPKIRETPGAVALKLADRIANVQSGGGLLRMYRKEQEDFRRMLYSPGQNEQMWARLDALLAEHSTSEEK